MILLYERPCKKNINNIVYYKITTIKQIVKTITFFLNSQLFGKLIFSYLHCTLKYVSEFFRYF